LKREILHVEFFRTIFDALPSPLFIVDDDVQIFHVNQAASGLLINDAGSVYKKRGGDALHCIHAATSPEGCGRGVQCHDCVIRNAVHKAFHGGKVHRKKALMTITTSEGQKDIHALVTASPFHFDGRDFALLILEDISELLQLRSLLPICAWCKKIRNDQNYWQNLEEYLITHHDIDFSHGMCEECQKKHFPEIDL